MAETSIVNLFEIPGYNDLGVTSYRLDNYFGAYRLKNDIPEAFDFVSMSWKANNFSKVEFNKHLDSKPATKEEVYNYLKLAINTGVRTK